MTEKKYLNLGGDPNRSSILYIHISVPWSTLKSYNQSMSNLISRKVEIDKLYNMIASSYGFPQNLRPSMLVQGVDNDFYHISINNTTVLIRFGKRNINDDILYETELLDQLGKTDVDVPELIKTKSSELFLRNGSTTITCFRYIPSNKLTYDFEHKPSISVVEQAGFMLGKLHANTYKIKMRYRSNKTIYSEIERALELSIFIEKTYEGGSHFLNELRTYCDFAKSNELKTLKGVIHNDYSPDNVLFLNSNLQAVIDFNWSCEGPLIKDVGLALALWSFPDKLEEHWSDVFDAFLSSYNKSAPGQIEKTDYLYRWICFSCLYDASTFFADLGYKKGKISKISQNRRYNKFKYFEHFCV